MYLKIGEEDSTSRLNSTRVYNDSQPVTKSSTYDHTETSIATKLIPSGLPSIHGYKFLSKGMRCEYPTPHDNLNRALEKCNNHRDVCKAIYVRFCDNRLHGQSYSTCSTAPVHDNSDNGCIFIRNGMLIDFFNVYQIDVFIIVQILETKYIFHIRIT